MSRFLCQEDSSEEGVELLQSYSFSPEPMKFLQGPWVTCGCMKLRLEE